EATANIALEKFQETQQAYDTALEGSKAAQATARQAQADLVVAQSAVAAFARDSYMSGSTNPAMQSLLASGSPGELLERAALLNAAADHRSAVPDPMSAAQPKAAGAQTVAP